SFLPSTYESVQALNLAHTAFPQQITSTAIVVVKRVDGAPLTDADQQRVNQLATAIANAHVKGTGVPLTRPQAAAPNNPVQLISLPITAPFTDQQGQMNAIRDSRDVIAADLAGSKLSAGVAGDAAQFLDNNSTFNKALAIVGGATFLLIIGLVLLI